MAIDLPAQAGWAGRRAAALGEEVRSAFDYMPATLAGNVAGVMVVALLFSESLPARAMAAWIGAFVLLASARAVLAWRFRAWLLARGLAEPSGPPPEAVPRAREWLRWRTAWNVGTLASGLYWGATAWLFHALGDVNQQVGLIVIVYTFCIAAVPVLATQPRVFLAFAALCFGPMVTRLLLDGSAHSHSLAGILALIFTLTSVLAGSFRNALSRAIALKVQADAMTARWRDEREAAEAARRVAEAANRAKSEFFAAASHDLRQPLHAMGLFAEALRGQRHDARTAALVDSVNASVDALEALFSELMDINRIDAGGVTPAPQVFEVDALWRRLDLHHRPVAFEQGLDLRWRGHRQAVHADPVLVERVMRNLLGNALRYTREGSVLVAARRRGERVWLQVWDTGPGIEPALQERVFEEFYRIPEALPAAAAGPDSPGWTGAGPEARRGMGLGLAIVRRLARLMDAPLRLRSQPGRGSVFEIALPAASTADGAAPQATASVAPPASVAGLHGRRFWVVDDDAAVRAGVQVLLEGWGAEVRAFASPDAAQAAARSWEPGRDGAPDLLIVDYRLGPGPDGLELLRSLRARFGPRLAAIVVSGSTLSGLEQRARAEGAHLLVKPVMPARLRAMVAWKLAGGQAGV